MFIKFGTNVNPLHATRTLHLVSLMISNTNMSEAQMYEAGAKTKAFALGSSDDGPYMIRDLNKTGNVRIT